MAKGDPVEGPQPKHNYFTSNSQKIEREPTPEPEPQPKNKKVTKKLRISPQNLVLITQFLILMVTIATFVTLIYLSK